MSALSRPGSQPPLGAPPEAVRAWFDTAAAAVLPPPDGTLAGARVAAAAYASRARADNTRRAYRAGVRAWCAWCDAHGLVPLPAAPDDVAAFLAAERLRGLSVATLALRRAAIRALHFLAGVPVPTAAAGVAATMAGLQRDAAARGARPGRKQAATLGVLRDILAAIPDDLPGLRDRALLLVGFAGALRRTELAALRVEHVEAAPRGLRLILPRSKGARDGRAVTVALPYGRSELCPVRALRRWQEAARISEGPLFRRLFAPPPRRADAGPPAPVPGTAALDPGSIARIVRRRAAAAGLDPAAFGGHSLKRGALTTGMEHGAHPTRLKQLARHRSYAALDAYLELGDPFESHPLNGLL